MRIIRKCRCFLLCLALLTSANGFAQIDWELNPERGLLSPDRYTNAYFGFALPFPKLADLQPIQPKTSQGVRTIFALQAHDKKPSTLIITAAFHANATEEDARRAAAGADNLDTTTYVLGGVPFFKSATEQKGPAGKRRLIRYVAGYRNYLLSFTIDSFDSKTAGAFERSIQSLKFVPFNQIKEIAGPDAKAFPNDLPKPSANRITSLSSGTVSGDVYFNPDLGLSFGFPQGWRVVDEATLKKILESGHQAAWGNDPAAQQEHALAAQCSRTLLYLSQPAETKGTNQPPSAEIITVYDMGCLPGAPAFPTSLEDAEAITLVGNALMLSLSATPFRPANKVRVLKAQDHLMIEVGGEYSFKLPNEPLVMRQNAAVVLMELNGYWVTITFSAHTESRVQELIKQAKLGFTSPKQ